MCTIVTHRETSGCTAPVKNTFIHFDLGALELGEHSSNKARSLRRSRTDPHSPPPHAARVAAAPVAGAAAQAEAAPATPLSPASTARPHSAECLNEAVLTPPLARHRAGMPISLAEDLVTPWWDRKSTPLATSCLAPLASSPASPLLLFEGGGVLFGFTLRRADGTGLGLSFMRSDNDRALLVQGVLPNGAIEAWNRQVVGSPNAGKAVVPGDKLVRVNTTSGSCESMVNECRNKLLVKLLFVRGGLDCEKPLEWLDAAAAVAASTAATLHSADSLLQWAACGAERNGVLAACEHLPSLVAP
mmetsp:Transcript_50018/g.116094  ORF Transcript_50018/g.116094 Transcript_50018/m.116094 type:complete len:302 (+) Transcript_50018:87-992(+)